MTFGESLAAAAPVYNLGLVLIALGLFVRLFYMPVKDKRVYLMPWKILFCGLLVFIVEEVLTVLRGMEILNIPIHINGFFEVIIISLFIYALLLQNERLKRL